MTCYNFDTHKQILIFFRCFNMPLQVTCASAIPGKRGNAKITFFHSNAVLVETAAAVGLRCTQCAVFLKEKLSSVTCLIASIFAETVRYSINTVHWLSIDFPLTFTQAWRRTTAIFYTETNTITDLANTEHVGNRQQDSRSCLVHPVDRFDSEGWFSCNQAIF